jgi:3-hydroxybutyryl-CoA dehydrogenase
MRGPGGGTRARGYVGARWSTPGGSVVRVVRAGVVGAGTMGAAIAELLAFNDIEVVLKDVDRPTVDRGLERVRAIVSELVAYHASRAEKELARIAEEAGELTEAQRAKVRATLGPKVSRERGEQVVAKVRGVTEYDDFADTELVIEAVFEREEVKRPVLQALDAVLPEHAVLGTNTSSLSVTKLARGLRHVRRTVVMHFFNPPSTLPLVEVAGGLETDDDVVQETVEFLQGLRNHRSPLVPIRTKESPAFVVNRLLIPVLNEACFALDERVATARDIDLAMKAGAGMPMGPFELADLIGLDVALEVAETLYRDFSDPKYRPAPLLRRMVAAGHLGRKSGRGFYDYPR